MDQSTESDWGAGYMCVLLGCWLYVCVCYWGAGYVCVLLGCWLYVCVLLGCWLYVCVIVMLTLQQDQMSENVAPEATISKETEEKVRLLEQAQTHLSAQHSVTEVGVVPQPSVAQGVTFFPLPAILLRVG